MSNRTSKLDGVHPDLVAKALLIINGMWQLHEHVMIVTDGVRTASEQMRLYKQGRSLPGRIVTYADGIIHKSNHQPHAADGFGHAVDMCFIVDGKASWDEHLPWAAYGDLARAALLRWGGDWAPPKTDKPHVEMPLEATRE